MYINSLGFTERRLYLFLLFLKTYPLKGYWEKVSWEIPYDGVRTYALNVKTQAQ